MPRLLTVFLCLLLASPAFAQVPDDLVESYLETTGLTAQAEQVGGQMAQQIQGQAAQFPEPAREPFREIYADAFDPEALRVRLDEYIQAEAEADRLREALAWYEQPLVVRMQEIEEAASEDDETQVAMQMYSMTGSFTDYTATPERETQVDEYLAATGASENAIDLYLSLIVASAESMTALRPDGEQPSADEIRAQMRPQLEGALGGIVRANALYTFREVTDEDFGTYIDLAEAPEAQYAIALNAAALQSALTSAIAGAGDRFVVELQKLDASGEIDLDAMRAEAEARAAQQQQMQQSAPMEDESTVDDDSMMEDDRMEEMEMEDDGQ